MDLLNSQPALFNTFNSDSRPAFDYRSEMLPALLLAAAPVPPFDMTNVADLRRQHCAAEAPDDFFLQETCIKMEIDGMAGFAAASKAIGRPLDAALEKCVEDHTANGIPSWFLIGTCAKMQADSYRNLHAAPERG